MQECSIVNGCLKRYAGDDDVVTIPRGVTEIAYRAFYGNKTLKKVILPEGLTKIDFQAFLDCRELAEIVFSDSLASVSRESFKNTAWLDNYSKSAVYAGPILLFVKDNPAEITVREGTKIIASDAFRNCTSLKKVILSQTLETIEHRAFQNCTALKSLWIPAAVKSLGDRVFLDCKNIEITLESVKLAIGRKCFPDDAVIHLRHIMPQELDVNLQMRAVAAFAADMAQEVAFSEAFLIKMKRYLSSKRRLLYKIAAQDKNLLRLMLEWEVIPADEADIILEEILNSGDGELVAALLRYKEEHNQAESALDEWDDDLSLDWEIAEEKSEEELKREWGFKENSDGTLSILRYYGSEEKVEVPSKIGERVVNDIAAEAFSPKRYGLGLKSIAKLKNIRQITIADGITQIGRYAFAYCENLTEVILPESVLAIDDYAFYGCKKLKRIQMAQLIEQIGRNAFAGCSELVLFKEKQ